MWLWGETDYISYFDMCWCPQLRVDRSGYANHCRCQLCQTLGGIYLTVTIDDSMKKIIFVILFLILSRHIEFSFNTFFDIVLLLLQTHLCLFVCHLSVPVLVFHSFGAHSLWSSTLFLLLQLNHPLFRNILQQIISVFDLIDVTNPRDQHVSGNVGWWNVCHSGKLGGWFYENMSR